MIKFADENTRPLVRQMWKDCFGDADQFMDIHFLMKYKDENTLIYFDGDEAVASLQMLPYSITFYGQHIPFSYLAGLCTLPQYRNRGYMGKLIVEAHRVIRERNIPLSILIPAEESLFGFYQKYGYQQVFEKDENSIPLKHILNTYPDMKEAYKAFDRLFSTEDFCVQKTFADFEAIVADYKASAYPPKSDLSGMACVIDPLCLLSMYAKKNLQQRFTITVKDTIGSHRSYCVAEGKVEPVSASESDLEVDMPTLCRLLFGYKTDDLGGSYKSFFVEHHPRINLMLE